MNECNERELGCDGECLLHIDDTAVWSGSGRGHGGWGMIIFEGPGRKIHFNEQNNARENKKERSVRMAVIHSHGTGHRISGNLAIAYGR